MKQLLRIIWIALMWARNSLQTWPKKNNAAAYSETISQETQQEKRAVDAD